MSDFRAETLYFIVVDRFCDGNPGNNIGKGDDYDATRTDWYKWWGGDLHGVLSRLDYLQSLGATAIWLTPLFDQMDGMAEIDGKRISAYHGYWAKDFKRIDEHFVEREEDVRLFTRDDTIFDRLVAEMHRRGMKLVLDVVCNHSSPSQAGGRGELYDDGVLVAHYDDRTAGRWYRRAAEVSDWSDLHQIQTRELAGLADFDEESWEYRRYIKGALRAWIDKGVDAFRVDTVKHMPLWFWQEFTGDMLVHRPELFMFGEWFQAGCWDADSVQFARWSGMSIIDFAWRNAVVNALAHRTERGFVELGAVIDRDDLFRDPSVLVTFVDNHDLPRFLSIANDAERFRQAVLLTMVARGIPCLYYGGEQLLHDDTHGGHDPYNRPWMSSWETTAFARD
ncbi:MAG: cyclomaltodextrin glucanotransferase, partial [Deltaproteobacteria bacterium]|nr:cyclomaltodextrin glucanotransferase [Deltaproteobacteria bacterium]